MQARLALRTSCEELSHISSVTQERGDRREVNKGSAKPCMPQRVRERNKVVRQRGLYVIQPEAAKMDHANRMSCSDMRTQR
ncbi:hypothetical protein EON67_06865 [archaeon]|nr:MAG: hypothetical protein EON67_06865 [archaeon]